MSLVDFMAKPYNEVKPKRQTEMHNYLGYNPTMQNPFTCAKKLLPEKNFFIKKKF